MGLVLGCKESLTVRFGDARQDRAAGRDAHGDYPGRLVSQGHPIRRIKPMVERALAGMSATFDRMYADNGRASIPPEHLLQASLLMALFSVRSERQFCERLEYDLLFKWFLDLNIMDRSFDHSVFSKNRKRLLEAEAAREFLLAVVGRAREQRLLSEEHFSVDGTLLEAWASVKSFRPRDDEPPSDGGRNPEVDFHGERRRNATHQSSTDPESRLAKKGQWKEAKLCFGASVLMDNRQGLIVDLRLTPVEGSWERDAAIEMLSGAVGGRRITVGADRGYDIRGLVGQCRQLGVTPHVTRKKRSAIDARTMRHEGYRLSQRVRKRVEEVFGWVKTVGGGRKLRYLGLDRNRTWAELTAAGYNLVRLARLTPVAA